MGFLTLLKFLPLGIFLRSAACKFGLPILQCDGPACPLAFGLPWEGEGPACTVSANTAEQMGWCEVTYKK